MCGIVGYVGSRAATPIVIEGLKRLEYRGYDSAGIATMHAGKINVVKTIGRVANLEDKLETLGGVRGTIGMCHTRWATHGGVTDPNAHPHTDDRAGICLIHNGIIENYASLKNAIDFLHNEWKHKAVCFLSYGGVSAGTRAMQALEPVVLSVGMAPVASAVTVPFAAQFLDDDGVVQPNEIMTASAKTMLDDLAAQTAALATRRAAI